MRSETLPPPSPREGHAQYKEKNPHGLSGGSNEDVLINNNHGPNEGVKSRSEESIHKKEKTE
jgi:hypothetical protein